MTKKIITLAFTCLFTLLACKPSNEYIQITGYAQGGTYSIKLNLLGKDGKIKTKPEKIKEGVDSIFNVIDTTLSGYNKGSMVSRFNNGETIVPNKLFKDIYKDAYNYWVETEGKLDVACAKLYNLWGFGFTNDSLPSNEKVHSILDKIGMKHLKKEVIVADNGQFNGHSLILDGDEEALNPELNYNAIAQGYSCDLIAKYLYSLGVKDMLVEVGEIYCDGLNPQGKPWSIGVDRPFDGNNDPGAHIDGIWTSDGKAHGVVTSGNYRKFYIKDGKKYSHTIDPISGYPVTHNLLSATIIANDSMTADAYATYCMVIGLDKAIGFIESREDIEGYLIYEKDGHMLEWSSKGFNLKENK